MPLLMALNRDQPSLGPKTDDHVDVEGQPEVTELSALEEGEVHEESKPDELDAVGSLFQLSHSQSTCSSRWKSTIRDGEPASSVAPFTKPMGAQIKQDDTGMPGQLLGHGKVRSLLAT